MEGNVIFRCSGGVFHVDINATGAPTRTRHPECHKHRTDSHGTACMQLSLLC